MISISPIQSQILVAIATYKWLTVSQAFRIIQNKSIHTIYNDMKTLKDRGFIDSVVYGGVSRSGTMQKLNFLTPKGAKIVAEDLRCSLDEIKYPKSTNTIVKNDFVHRIATVSAAISLNLWAEKNLVPVQFIDYYFDKTGSQRRKDQDTPLHSKTRVEMDQTNQITQNKFIDPDVIFSYTVSGDPRLFILEIANGRDTARIIKQIRQNLYAAYQGYVGQKYNYEKTPRILVAIERENTLNAVLVALKNDPAIERFEYVDQFLFLGLQEEIFENWHNWLSITGNKTEIF